MELADWLADQGVTHLAMESTGVYWKPIWNLLEDQLQILLVNAQHIKQVPGRKTDVKDAEWIAQLLQQGLLRGSLVPATPQRGNERCRFMFLLRYGRQGGSLCMLGPSRLVVHRLV